MHFKKAWVWLSVVLLLCLMPVLAGAEGMRGYEKGNGWQYVHFGEYPYEKDGTVAPVLWRILDITDGKALLLTENIIDTQQVIFETNQWKIENYDYRRITTYEESDLYTWLNTVALDTLLGNAPMRNALVDEPGGGKLFILDMMEFLNTDYGFSANKWDNQPTRHAKGTPYAIKTRGLFVDHTIDKSPYWVATVKDPTGYKLALVGYNGHLSWGAYTRTNVGLRLSVRLDLSQVKVSEGTGTKKDPFVLVSSSDTPYVPPVATEQPQDAAQLGATAAPAPTALPTPVPAPTRVPDSDGEVLLSFVGDCSIGDSEQYVGYETSYHSIIDEKGYDWPFSLVRDYLAADDLTIANLEVVLTTKYAHSDKVYNLKAAPDHVNVLLEGSIEMVNTVNNHCMDFYDAGYEDTLENLDNAGIAWFGSVYPGQENGHDDLGVQEINGIRIGFIGFTYPQDYDQKKIANRIKTLKEEQGCDLVVVSLHWGRETQSTQDSGQVIYAKEIIDAGADVIWGHHPHVIQPIHFYKGKPIMYSTGNFTFGTMSQVDPATGIFQLAYEKVDGEVRLTRLQVIPCETQGSPDYRPYVLTDEDARRAVFAKLRMRNEYAKCVNLPESFLETGVVYFENGEMLQ